MRAYLRDALSSHRSTIRVGQEKGTLMNVASDLVLQAEMSYRAERVSRQWGPVRRRRASRRQGRSTASQAVRSDLH